MQFNTLLLS